MTCKTCGGTGRLPFIRPNGTISNSAVVYCECYREDESGALPSTGRRTFRKGGKLPQGRKRLYADDFDFPMSYSFYQAICDLHGWPVPESADIPEPLPETLQPISRAVEPSIGSRQLDHIRGQVLHIQNKMNEHIDASKKAAEKKQKYITYSKETTTGNNDSL